MNCFIRNGSHSVFTVSFFSNGFFFSFCFCAISVLQSHHNQLKIPRTGEPTTIIPTCMLSSTEFYGQLGSHYNALEFLQQRLNTRRSRYEYEPYTQIPGIFHLLFRYEMFSTLYYFMDILIIYLQRKWVRFWFSWKMHHFIGPEYWSAPTTNTLW